MKIYNRLKMSEHKIPKSYLKAQRDELTDSIIYEKMSHVAKDEQNRKTFHIISQEEKHHEEIWRKYTGRDVKASGWKIFFYFTLIRFFGITFGIKLLEHTEHDGVQSYQSLPDDFEEADELVAAETKHEDELIDMLNDKSLDYLGSIVLGLNDALVELLGALAGLTLGLKNSKVIASVGIITGISAALSMAASEYLSTKTDSNTKVNPMTASIYTGLAYVITVVLLILPYLLVSNIYISLLLMVAIAVIIIAFFNFYISVVKTMPFKRRFLEMVSISLGVAFISFFIGLIVNKVFDINV
ncbi:MAG: VIT1/CCC1 transporter family protein [Bacteroidales bacterium]|nr:VIT1/CCC1 transporter family protein [Bacteroidales bacterium]MCI1785289.1 VIT1/CCC1 transporter family protein [Bacteroidales bacterium]